MQFDANLAPARANSVHGQAGSSIASEIDLYDELLTFVDMTPAEQRLYLVDTKSANEASQPTSPESVEPGTADKVEPESVSSPVDSANAFGDSTPLDETLLAQELKVTLPNAEMPGLSEPLEDLNLDGAVIGATQGKDCIACGAESGADDLFCLSCGSFLNGVAATSPTSLVCADCSQSISVEEIFCPWCGSVLAGN